jgi:hypothetical protein
MMVWLSPAMIVGRARGIWTLRSTCHRVAPNAWAASTFKSTLERFRRYPEIFEALLEFFGVEDPEKAGSGMKWHS